MSFLDNVVTGLFTSKLKDVTPDQCRETILADKPLVQNADEQTWIKYRRIASVIPGLDITYDDVLTAVSKNRPDLLAVICTTPGGVDWLAGQVQYCRAKLGFCKPSAFTKD